MVLAAVRCDGIDSAMEPDAVKQALMAAPSVMSIAKFASGRHPGPPDIRQLRQGVRGADQPSEARRLPGGGGVGGSSTRRDRETTNFSNFKAIQDAEIRRKAASCGNVCGSVTRRLTWPKGPPPLTPKISHSALIGSHNALS